MSAVAAPVAAPVGTPAAAPDAPGPRSRSPLGSIPAFRRDILRALGAGRDAYGDLVRYRLGPVVVHGVTSPELAEQVLTDSATYGKLGPENPLRLVLGTGLLTSSDHESWLRNRRMMQPVFHRKNIDGLFTTMTGCADEMLDHLAATYRPGDEVDLHTEMMRVTLDIVSRCMFSADVMDDLDRIGPHAVDTAVNYAFARLQNPFSPPTTWPTPTNRRFARVMAALDEMMYGLIAERRAGEPRGDLLDMLLAAEDADTGERMTDRELRDEIITMFAAGHETTAITLTWTWYLLSRRPDVLARVQAEVDAALGGRTPTLADLPAMPYTLAVFEESMRLYPSAPIVPRLTSRDTVLGGHRLPAGSRVLVSLFHVHRDPRHWPDPERFDPERFDPAAKKGRHRYAYIPFGAGPHLCIGKHFALLEAHLLLASIAQRYELRHLPYHPVAELASITLRPRYGMRMTMHPRRPARAEAAA